MEAGLPMLNCLLQHTLRSLCASAHSPNWVYAVFWRILPRNYPPPKWDHGGGLLDRAKGNKRNWILVWEDGFCDFCECERAGNGCVNRRFGADVFFKMTHEVYNFGEGLVGKVASDNSHKWVFRDSPTETDPSFISPWNVSIDPQPRAWEAQFSSGIETIALISVREGAIQLGSFEKVVEDLNMVQNIRRKFSYLQSIPGIYTIQRPHIQIQSPQLDYSIGHRLMQTNAVEEKQQQLMMMGSKRQSYEDCADNSPTKSICLGYNAPQHGAPPMWCIPPLLPSNIGPCYGPGGLDHDSVLLGNLRMGSGQKMKGGEWGERFGEISAVDVKVEMAGEGVGVEDGAVALGFDHSHGGAGKCCKS